MLFTTILASTIALGMGVSAAPTASPSPNPNYRYVQLRVFGAPGCSELNQGELGVYGDSLNKCQTFSDITIKSVSFEAKYQESCTVALYDDATCETNRREVEVGTCLSGDDSEQYRGYIVECPGV
ncbi:hypothetical protein BDV40DRAFT_282624 [Aspergillus tamarii]|uniref:Uncharacterized protein n=1 Tax=Aspergillus tamarii TaxID=41984 RepID=A0A5N6UBE1_ASPTM|nr:hypothetical protein BDV40DRAFT_282624 [Aspergillus tamarii]